MQSIAAEVCKGGKLYWFPFPTQLLTGIVQIQWQLPDTVLGSLGPKHTSRVKGEAQRLHEGFLDRSRLCECKKTRKMAATPAIKETLERADVSCQCRAGVGRENKKRLLLNKFRREIRQWGRKKTLDVGGRKRRQEMDSV